MAGFRQLFMSIGPRYDDKRLPGLPVSAYLISPWM